MKVNLVFEGGGILGVAFIGAYQSIDSFGYIVERCGGTSAGAIFSSLVIAGYKPKELLNIMKSTDFSKLLKKTPYSRIPVFGKGLSLLVKKGIYDYRPIETWVEKMLAKKGIRTFNDVTINGQSRLKIIAADVTNRDLLILPDDALVLGIEPGNLSIAKAVAMSVAIPLVFTPIVVEKDRIKHFVVDGGLMSSFPIWVFDVEDSPKYPTLGIKIKDEVSFTQKGKTGFWSYLKDLFNATYLREETSFLSKEKIVDVITIDFDNTIRAMDFGIHKDRLEYLYRCGLDSTNAFLASFEKIKSIKSVNVIARPQNVI
ncbi:MAG TPA: patatin-like phospholipase family protein [Bacilli bacterium]|jgi:NTE family protein|nr:patatin-like phospholipase family protein [Acholeplasmataceae bacterium]OQB64215.1 MAG: Patatin-like phospholipase [Tenericutes bacterium ADurb.Bin140]HOE77235.1 patatin-like phospholipase family protein [Bacilli bacterium]HON63599.1 patatin-like phospholipase family protein [Bacilli bacterium]HOR95791.1 patatin-like phospholipase family protein [Bacilli bacterium]